MSLKHDSWLSADKIMRERAHVCAQSTQDKRNSLLLAIKEVTFHHSCIILLITQTISGSVWEGNAQDCEYLEAILEAGYHIGKIPCQLTGLILFACLRG